MKIYFKIISLLLFVIILLGTYLSIFGVETNKFNKQIQDRIKDIDGDLNIELKKVKLVLNPIKFNISAKTLGPKIIKQNKYLELENIETSISLKSIISDEFLIEQIEISTKSIEISNLISFARSIYQIPELIILEKLFDVQGYIIANVKVQFEKDGSIKDNYVFTGFVKDTKINLSKDYNLTKLNLFFDITKDDIDLENLNVRLNNFDLESKKISAKKIDDGYLVKGNIQNDIIDLNNKDLIFFKEKFFSNLDIKKIRFYSKNEFSLKINNKLQLRDTIIFSKIEIQEAKIKKKIKLEETFPEFKNDISFKIDLNYKKDFY